GARPRPRAQCAEQKGSVVVSGSAERIYALVMRHIHIWRRSSMRPVGAIRSWEMATGIIIAALLRTLLGLIPVSLMAWAFFGYSIYSLGLPLVAFFAILQMFSWSIGLAMSGMIMRVGQSAESFAWAAVFILMPVSGVYYPVTVLPHWLQVISWGLPPAYV